MATQWVNYSDSANGWDVTIYWECEPDDTSAYVWWTVNQNSYSRTFAIVVSGNSSNKLNSGVTLSVGTKCYFQVFKNGSYSQQKGPFTITAPEPEEPEEPEEPDVSASTITLGASSVQMGENLLITIERDSTACEHYLTCWFSDDVELDIAYYVGTSHVWTVPDLTYLCENSTSESFWIVCYTYVGDEYIGYTEEEVTLTVPDPTKPSVEGGEVTLGQVSTILCKRNSASFTVKLELEFKDTTVNIASGKLDSRNWTPGYNLAKQIPNLTYGTGTLKCITMNGTATVGSETTTIRVNVPEDDVTKPAFDLNGLVLAPISYLGEEFAGIYIRGKTGLEAEMTATSEYSSIQTYSITVGSLSAEGNPAVIDTLVNDGDVKVTATATDARGYSRTIETTIYVMPYRSPRIIPYTGYSDVICERAKSNGELSSNGTYLAIKAGKSFSSVILNGVEKNSCSLRYRWRPNGATSFTDWITLLAEGSAETEVSLLVGNVVSSLQTSYVVEIEAIDSLDGKHTLTFQIMTEAISFVLYDGPDGAGFGKYPEAPHVVDIASHMTLLVRGKLEVTGSQWVSLGLASGINESVYAYGRKEDSGCHYLVSNGNHVYTAFNCGFTYSGTARVINATPIPADFRPARPVFSLCPINDRAVAMVSIKADGYIRVELVQKLTDTVNTGSMEVIWIDGYLDYWT
jgi:hypothetical protein